MVALGARNGDGGVDWTHMETSLDLEGMIGRQLLPRRSGHGGALQLQNWHSDGDDYHRNHFVQNKSSLWLILSARKSEVTCS